MPSQRTLSPQYPASSAARPAENMMRLSALSRAAVSAAEDTAIPRSIYVKAQRPPASWQAPQPPNPQRPQCGTPRYDSLAPISTTAWAALILAASLPYQTAAFSFPKSRAPISSILSASASLSFPVSTAVRILSTPFPFGAVRAAAHMRAVVYLTASSSSCFSP